MTQLATTRGTLTSSFAAMGTTATITIVGGSADMLDSATRLILDLHRRWTRFDPSSEISQINQSSGSLAVVEPDTFAVISAAVAAAARTKGAYDPTVGRSMRALGYDRTLNDIPRLHGNTELIGAPGTAAIELLPELSAVILAPGTEIDLGGIGKGAAADAAAEMVMASGASGVCVNIGGDLRVEGLSPTAEAWAIEITPTAQEHRQALVVRLESGAVCTSRTDLRTWSGPNGDRHHIITPSTGEPVDTALRSVTVLARTATSAEPLTKAALVAGPKHARQVLDAHDAPAVIVGWDSSIHAVGSIREYLR
jgi:FAD:protein FMN transferase